jgi:hypothetical protein
VSGVTIVKDVSDALRNLADQIDATPELITVRLEAKIHRPITAETLLEKEKAMIAGYVIDIESPTQITIKFDGDRIKQ